jgi:outer membrane protein assembly factor BamB
VDVDSGILLWEFKTGGKIRSAPALADGRLFAASWDGFLYAVTAESGKQVWKAPLAPYTRTAPAVTGGRVFIGDESGHMRSFQAADGQAGFDLPLGGRISHVPVVTPNGVCFVSEQGHMAMVSPDGQAKWNRKLDADVLGQPFATQSQLLIPTAKGIEIVKQADGQSDERIHMPPQPGRLLAALPYGNRLCLLVGGASTSYGQGPVTYAGYYSLILIWAPEEKR